MRNSPRELAERLGKGDRGAVARLITWAENDAPGFAEVANSVHDRIGNAWRTGVTGPPGAGKSTLVNELTQCLRAKDRTVGVLAVDPSSPFTGGALLGDRIRMEERTTDSGVFIRSMASRDSHGGLARASVDACDMMDAFGFDEILVETVGVGQAEYDVVSAADTVLVVLCPGAGDGVQAMKAGLLEVADVLCVNKSDRPGADRLVSDLSESVHMRMAGRSEWITPVVSCSAGRGEGIEPVLDAIEQHREFLKGHDLPARRLAKRTEQVIRVVGERLHASLWSDRGYQAQVRDFLESGVAPYDVAERILAEFLRVIPDSSGSSGSSGGQKGAICS